mmetsp:Transcript_32381/g.84081  ORF Transcript_32381/g.84081 Transcript_32381/m.84081 type:complete len:200 (+) Transcript_32381:817-1416(+)
MFMTKSSLAAAAAMSARLPSLMISRSNNSLSRLRRTASDLAIPLFTARISLSKLLMTSCCFRIRSLKISQFEQGLVSCCTDLARRSFFVGHLRFPLRMHHLTAPAGFQQLLLHTPELLLKVGATLFVLVLEQLPEGFGSFGPQFLVLLASLRRQPSSDTRDRQHPALGGLHKQGLLYHATARPPTKRNHPMLPNSKNQS